jgi:hypothetical protein
LTGTGVEGYGEGCEEGGGDGGCCGFGKVLAGLILLCFAFGEGSLRPHGCQRMFLGESMKQHGVCAEHVMPCA